MKRVKRMLIFALTFITASAAFSNLTINNEVSASTNENKSLVCKTTFREDGYVEKIQIGCKYDTNEDMIIQFSDLGINKITHPTEVKFVNNDKEYPQDDLDKKCEGEEQEKRSYTIGTDWVSPYYIKNDKKEDEKPNKFATGGNHGAGADNKAEGIPTAKKVSTTVKINDKEVDKNNNIPNYCDKVEIITVNKIAAYNDFTIDTSKLTLQENDYAIEETVRYIITQGNIEVEVNLKALKDNVSIEQYAGLQISNTDKSNDSDVYTKFYFAEDQLNFANDDKPKGFIDFNYANKESNYYSESKSKNGTNLDRIVVKNDSGDMLVSYIDRSFGIGNLEYFYKSASPAMRKNKKLYLHSVTENTKITLPKDQSCSYRGGYTFTKKNKNDDKYSLYTTKQDGETTYVIDTFIDGEVNVELPSELNNKNICIEKASENLTVKDTTVKNNNLTINGVKYGQLKFTVKNEIEPGIVLVKNNADTQYVSFRYDDSSNIVITFGQNNVNKITQVESIKKVSNTTNEVIDNYSINSSLISPYRIITDEKELIKTIGRAGMFDVGGSCGTNISNLPTARHISTKVYSAGAEVKENETKSSSNIIIKTVNRISASNAIALIDDSNNKIGDKVDSVEETVKYTIKPNKIEIEVQLEALAPVNISSVGLQFNKSMFKEFTVNKTDNPTETYWGDTEKDVADFSYNGDVNKTIDCFKMRNDKDQIMGYIDRSYGAGNLQYLNTGDSVLSYKNGTLKFNTISGINLEAGNKINYKAGYKLEAIKSE